MTKPEFNEMAALIVSVRRDVEAMIAKGAALEAERDDLAKQLAAHVESLKLSNAQCGEYLLHNEMIAADRATLHKELVDVRAALAAVSAERDSLKRTLLEWEEAETKPHVRVEPVSMTHGPAGSPVFIHEDSIADHVVAPLCFDCGSRLVNVGGLFSLCRSAECMKRTQPGAP